MHREKFRLECTWIETQHASMNSCPIHDWIRLLVLIHGDRIGVGDAQKMGIHMRASKRNASDENRASHQASTVNND